MKSVSAGLITLFLATLFVSPGCKVGDNDPFLTFHSRDARLTQQWRLTSMEGTIVQTTDGNTTNIVYKFDGTTLYITTNDVTTSYAYTFVMDIKNDGDVVSAETEADPSNPSSIIQLSSKDGYWYWGSDNQNKSSVVLDLTGVLADYKSFDIPRLAWTNMTLSINSSDNYTNTDDGTASSVTVNFSLDFTVDTSITI